MKAGRSLLIIGLVAALIIVAILLVKRPRPLSVTTVRAERGMIEATVVNTRAGTVKVCRRAGLSPSVGGQIATWPVSEGMTVKKGDLLLALWNDDLRAQLDLAESDAEAAKANAEGACLQADIAGRQFDRHLKLKKVGATTEEILDRLDTEAKVAQSHCKATTTVLQVSRDRISLARANLARTFLFAPFDGVIAQLNGELGEYVTPSPVGVQTLPAVDLIDTSCYYVAAPIDEVDAAAIRPGMAVRISLDAFRDRTFAGRVKRISDYVLDLEKQARTVEVEVEFMRSEDTVGLLPGYSADVEIIITTRENVLCVPSEAIINGIRVFVLKPDNRLSERRITIGLANWDLSEVTAGVAEGEMIVVGGDRQAMQDGAPARAESDGND
ncbi:MAG: efflux RND transporter periplasmic adaptor subunit [Thermodesulfobacteriota bacterium]